MSQQSVRQTKLLSLSLGIFLLGATLPAHAEPDARNEVEEASPASAEASPKAEEQVTELTVKTVMLPADDEAQSRGNRRLRISSGTLFAVGYAPALITTLANSKGTSGWLAAPIVGPWIDWGPNTSAGNKVLLFTSGLFQAVGLVGFVSSYFLPESKTKKVPMMGRRRVNVSPVASRDTYLLSATGTF